MKIYEVIQPRIYEYGEKEPGAKRHPELDNKVDLVQVKSAWNHLIRQQELDYPEIRFTNHSEARKDHGRDDSDLTTNITNRELLHLIDKSMVKYGKEIMSMPSNYQGVLQDSNSDINVPFVVKHKPDGRTELVAKTIMKEPNFRAGGNVFRV